MAYNVVTADLDIIRQQSIKKIIRLYILDFKYARVAEISGNMMTMNVAIDSESDLRRSCSVELVVVDDSYNVAAGGRIWLDKYIQPYIGYENIHTGEVQWYNQGIYLINAPSWQYDAETKTLSFAGLDLMSKLTGLRNGQLEGLTYSIPSGQNVRNVIIDTLKLAGFNNYVVSECISKNGSIVSTPYDIEISAGGTVYDILSELRDIMPNYEMFFDVDGVFIYQQIPTGDNEPTKIDDVVLSNILLNEAVDTDFEAVKNYIEVYGQAYDPDYYSDTTTYSGGVLNLTVSSLPTAAATVPNGVLIGFTAPQDINGPIHIKLNNLTTAMSLIDKYGESVYSLVSGSYYVIQWNYTDDTTSPYYYIGKQQISAIAKDDNVNSPFYIAGSIGMIREVLSGGEYDNIITDSLAQQQADYSLWQKTRLQDSISLSITPVPWLDVNDIIEHKAVGSDDVKKYIVKNISTDYGQVDGIQTITAITYYPTYNNADGYNKKYGRSSSDIDIKLNSNGTLILNKDGIVSPFVNIKSSAYSTISPLKDGNVKESVAIKTNALSTQENVKNGGSQSSVNVNCRIKTIDAILIQPKIEDISLLQSTFAIADNTDCENSRPKTMNNNLELVAISDDGVGTGENAAQDMTFNVNSDGANISLNSIDNDIDIELSYSGDAMANDLGDGSAIQFNNIDIVAKSSNWKPPEQYDGLLVINWVYSATQTQNNKLEVT